MKIADIIRTGIADGKDNLTILAEVKAAHPEANTNAACVNWYRNKAKKAADKVVKKAKTEAPSAPTKVAAATATVLTSDSWHFKNVTTFVGMEGYGYNATLYRGDKRVATVIDDASGGPVMIQWNDHKTMVDYPTKDYKGEPWVRRVTQEEKLLLDHCASLPQREIGDGILVPMDDEYFMYELMEGYQLMKDVKRVTKGKVAFIKVTDGKIYTIKGVCNDAMRKHIREKCNGGVIINDLEPKLAMEAIKSTMPQ